MREESRRNANIELLRIVSMFMILILHYFNNGKVLSLTSKGACYYIVWVVEAICLCSVNCYMLISGFFLSQKEFTWRRIITFYAQILFYTIVLAAICFLFNLAEFNFENLISILPIMSGKNWYVTAFFCLLFLSPPLNHLICTITQEKLRYILIIQFILFSILHTVFFYTDTFHLIGGYSVWWYCFVYMVGAYFCKYSVQIDRKYFFLFLSIFILPASKFFLDILSAYNEMFSDYRQALYNYNSFPVLACAVLIFDCFRRMKIFSKKLEKVILFFGKTSFAVFYIHTFVLLRDKLWVFLGSEKYIDSGMQFLHMLGCIVLVYILCTGTECCRRWLFKLLHVDQFILSLSNRLDRKLCLSCSPSYQENVACDPVTIKTKGKARITEN